MSTHAQSKKSGTFSETPKEKLGQVRILGISQIQPSPENDQLYKPVDPKDPEVRDLARSISDDGLMEPIVVTADVCEMTGKRWIVSGHRRYVAAQLAALHEVPCRISTIRHDAPDFVAKLREFNRQREKTLAEKLREEIVSANPEESYRALAEYRQEKSQVDDIRLVHVRDIKRRAKITDAKEPFLKAIEKVLRERRKFWPLSDRQIHYALLNHPPLIHANKPKSIYCNDAKSYKALTELLTRARLTGRISMSAIADPTRPVTTWDVHNTSTPFIRRELDGFLKGYYRDLQQSQPNHIEIVGEKNTVASIINPISENYCIPMTIGRGYCSLQPRYELAQRFKRSGKEHLILLVLSDFDPDGEEICHSLVRSLRDDFGVENIKAIKVGLTGEQVKRFKLPAMMQAKITSTHYEKFTREHGQDVYELEALSPDDLQSELQNVIDSVLDINAFNYEVEMEKEDACHLDELRQRAHLVLQEATET